MLKPPYKYILFVGLVILVDILLGYSISILSKKNKRDKRIELVLSNQVNADIIILGSSEALNDYSPESIKNNTGYSCYNLGVSGSNPPFHETMLDLILFNPHKPKLIIYNIDDIATLYTKKGIIYRSDQLYPYVDNSFINTKVCKTLNKNRIATLLSCSYRQNINFTSSIKYLASGPEMVDFRINNINYFGANLIDKREKDPPAIYLKKNNRLQELKINESYRDAFMNIQKKCRKNNIKLLLCFPPQYADHTPGFQEIIKKYTGAEVMITNFSDSINEPIYYYDSEHLNRTGAVLFSNLLSEEIKKITL